MEPAREEEERMENLRWIRDEEYGAWEVCPVKGTHRLNREPGGTYCLDCHTMYGETPRPKGGTCDCGYPRWHTGPCGSTF
jgi:hypothetical protein